MLAQATLALALAASSSRCNATMVDVLQAQVRTYDRGTPDGVEARRKRFHDLDAALHELDEERGVLDAVCATDAEKAPLLAELSATAAWALALQSDLVPSLTSCPAAAKDVQAAMLAQAWLDLAASAAAAGAGNATLKQVQPEVEARAKAAGLALPPFADASAYWRNQISDRSREAAAQACPASPRPSPP